jgi:ribosomal-protein-alanine N-acetyltransferase
MAGAMTSPVVLSTARLRLRDLDPADYDDVRALDADPAVQWWRGALTISPEETRTFLAEVTAERDRVPRPRWVLGITVPPRREVIGTCWLLCHWPDWLGSELGYQLAKTAWGHGYATEATRALVTFGFATVGLRRIWARVNPGNEASCRVVEKAGLRREGLLRRCEFAAGEWRDLALYAALADECGISSRTP